MPEEGSPSGEGRLAVGGLRMRDAGLELVSTRAGADAAPYRPSQRPQISGTRRVEHVFARQKGPMGLFIRTIGIVCARTKIGLANLTYNMQRTDGPGHLTRTTHRPAGPAQRRARQSTDHFKPECPLPARPENTVIGGLQFLSMDGSARLTSLFAGSKRAEPLQGPEPFHLFD